MRTIITKRSFLILIFCLLLLSGYTIIREHYANAQRLLDIEISNIIRNNRNEKDLYRLTMDSWDNINRLSVQFATILLLTSIISFVILINRSNMNEKSFLILSYLIIILTIFSIVNMEYEFNSFSDDEYYVSYLIFLPYVYYIYRDSILGEKVDITDKVKQKIENLHNENVNELDKLLEMDLISKTEYSEKKEKQIKDKIKKDLKNSDVYDILLKSKEKGLITEDEMNDKIENLIKRKYKDITQ